MHCVGRMRDEAPYTISRDGRRNVGLVGCWSVFDQITAVDGIRLPWIGAADQARFRDFIQLWESR